MSPSLQAYNTLPSESRSTYQTSCPSESQLTREQVRQSTVPPTSRFWTSWEWEFAACLFVLATLVITFATLYPYNDQPLPQWPFKISINSLLSVYSLILKASIGFILASCIGQLQWAWFSDIRPLSDMVCFDSATRGADGALSLIWHQKFRQPLTTLGLSRYPETMRLRPCREQMFSSDTDIMDMSIAAGHLHRREAT
ncbi:hypothetical protein F5883DRAFT_579566 [Diaporthe sp. PMI_573]|nr:hypothetical protein F5883DRAFT_579566 [Diaporthaceae sp. PMI_573]